MADVTALYAAGWGQEVMWIWCALDLPRHDEDEFIIDAVFLDKRRCKNYIDNQRRKRRQVAVMTPEEAKDYMIEHGLPTRPSRLEWDTEPFLVMRKFWVKRFPSMKD